MTPVSFTKKWRVPEEVETGLRSPRKSSLACRQLSVGEVITALGLARESPSICSYTLANRAGVHFGQGRCESDRGQAEEYAISAV